MSVVLCGKPCQHINGLMIAVGTAKELSEFFDPAVFEKADGLGRRGNMLLLVRALPIVAIPVLAMLERIGRQVELSRGSLPNSVEVGQVPQDVRVSNGFGDLPVVGGVSPQ